MLKILSASVAVVAFVAFLPSAFAQVADPNSFSVFIPDKEMLELNCLVARAEGGEAVASARAFADSVREPLQGLHDTLVLFSLNNAAEELTNSHVYNFDARREGWEGTFLEDSAYRVADANLYDGYAYHFAAQIEKICRESRVDVQQLSIQLLSNESAQLVSLASDFENEILPFTSQLNEEIERRDGALAERYAERAREEAETRLQEQADAEIVRRTAELEARIEAEVTAEITDRAMAGEFGEISGLPPYPPQMQTAIDQLTEQKRRAAKEALRRELTARYDRLSAEEETRLEAEAAREGGEEQEAELRGQFANIEREARDAYGVHIKAWAQFGDLARERKRDIFMKVFNAQVENAKAWVLENRDKIEEAHARDPHVQTADEIIRVIDQESLRFLANLENEPLFREVAARVKPLTSEDFQGVWDDIRLLTAKIDSRIRIQVIADVVNRFINPLVHRVERDAEQLETLGKTLEQTTSKCEQWKDEQGNLKQAIFYGRGISDDDIQSFHERFGQVTPRAEDYIVVPKEAGTAEQVLGMDIREVRYAWCAARFGMNKAEGVYVTRGGAWTEWSISSIDPALLRNLENDLTNARALRQSFLDLFVEEFPKLNADMSPEELIDFQKRILAMSRSYKNLDETMDSYLPAYLSRNGWRSTADYLRSLVDGTSPNAYSR